MDCEKHNRNFVRTELEHGKTLDVCPDCEQEKLKMFENLFERERFLDIPMADRFHKTHESEVIDTIKVCNKIDSGEIK